MEKRSSAGWVAYFAKPAVFGAFLGLIFGAIAYGLSLLTMKWLNNKQLSLIVPWFVMTGLVVGIFIAWTNRKN